MFARWAIGFVLLVVGCQGGNSEPTLDATPDARARDASGLDARPRDAQPGDAGVVVDGGVESGDAGMVDAGARPACLSSAGTAEHSNAVVRGVDRAEVQVVDDTPCRRSYTLSSTQPLRDPTSDNPRRIDEVDGETFLRSGDVMLDALYAMTQAERRLLSVDQIRNGAFEEGRPIPCGGCFETGRLWTWVWTRDTAFATDLGLGVIDPARAIASLEFKVSPRRDGTDPQLVQDTGSGGSYPVSTDRVSWALGSARTRAALVGAARDAHDAIAYAALRNTAAHDRAVAFDTRDGLYRGEHSFLDWREQSYAPWTAQDTVHIAMSKALSTNVLHLLAIEHLATLAAEAGDDAATYTAWANDLRAAIHTRFWLEDEGLWSSHLPTTLDVAPARRFDLLGVSLAVLAGIGSTEARARAVASYPHLDAGPPVMWPPSAEVPIYHNRAIWPFVTAYGLRAAKAVDNAAVVTHAARSLYHGAALNLSNMENLEAETGRPWVEDGPWSGPVVNSERQLWSVAAFYTLVHEIVFGIETAASGVQFSPGLTRALRRTWFDGKTSVALNDVPWRGGRLTVELVLPDAQPQGDAILTVDGVILNGSMVGRRELTDTDFTGDDHVRVVLVDDDRGAGAIRLADGAVRAPVTPSINGILTVGGAIRVQLDRRGAPADATWSLYRDGQRIVQGLGGTDTYDDTTATGASHCYAAELERGGVASHRSSPSCFWGDNFVRTSSYYPAAFTAVGGTLVNNHGRAHYEGWGDPGHSLEVNITPNFSGPHLLQVVAGNGAGAIDSGVTCGVERVRVFDPSNTMVGEGYFVMPHLGDWSRWSDSSFVSVDLVGGVTYRVRIDRDDRAINMSALSHYDRYTAGLGGAGGAFHRVNIAELKLLARTGAP